MSRDALSRLFGITSGFISLYALSAWSLSQGGSALSAVPGLEPRAPAQSAYFAIVIIGIVLFVVSAIGIAHLRRPAGKTGWRFPVVGLGDTEIDDARAWSIRIYVAFLAVLLLILPASALVHLNLQLVGNGWVWNEQLPASTITKVSCALPLWPFGVCDTSNDRALADAIFAAPELKDGKLTEYPGRLWLASHPCDLQWNRGLSGSQAAVRLKEGGPLVSPSEEGARKSVNVLPPPLRDRLLATLPKPDAEPAKDPDYCVGFQDRSALCKDDEAKCRGVAWLRVVSPVLVMVPSLLGWGGVLAFFIIWWRLERLPSKQHRRNASPRSPTSHDVT